ncbi:MAG TPA: hypothetical protein VFG20_10690 [Planctomycetaceae bacterium]|nr:hypothetical protein [Planctomycetaceae bacterium]
MSQTVPPRFLFRFAFAAPYLADFPPKALPPELPAGCGLPSLSDLDGTADFAEWRCGWNERGLAVSVTVRGKQQAPKCDPLSPKTSDGVQLWIDTRCTQNVHRATRFCHQFVILPSGRGTKQREPSITQLPLANARDEAAARSADASITLSSAITADGYQLCVWFPAAALHGFEPDSHSKLGFYAVVRDAERGEQFLTVGREFPIDFDPSLWQTLELVK